jgi:2-aminoadipate transaminase
MNVDFADFFPVSVKATLANDPPGAWIPHIPDGCIRLSAGYPAPSLVPTDEIPVAVKRMIEEEGHLPFQYLGSPRMQKLRSQVRQRLLERGMAVGEDELLIPVAARLRIRRGGRRADVHGSVGDLPQLHTKHPLCADG